MSFVVPWGQLLRLSPLFVHFNMVGDTAHEWHLLAGLPSSAQADL